jgi:hypothetical protein
MDLSARKIFHWRRKEEDPLPTYYPHSSPSSWQPRTNNSDNTSRRSLRRHISDNEYRGNLRTTSNVQEGIVRSWTLHHAGRMYFPVQEHHLDRSGTELRFRFQYYLRKDSGSSCMGRTFWFCFYIQTHTVSLFLCIFFFFFQSFSLAFWCCAPTQRES